jgi:uncharacterized protein (DUF2126 family)
MAKPIWQDPALFADEHVDYHVTSEDAGNFLRLLADRLDIDAQYVQDAYEDVWYYLWRERRLPVNVDPFDAKLDDPLERARIAKVFGQSLDHCVGYVMPLARNSGAGPRWQTGPWFLRSERMYLIPGDSPLGYRLPLDSQPWAAKGDFPWIHEPDTMQEFPPLPLHAAIRQMFQSPLDATRRSASAFASKGSEGKATALKKPARITRAPHYPESAAWITRTAICAEPRNGVLYLFMPPLAALEDYLELVAAIEDTAAQLKQPVCSKATSRRATPRLDHLRITPDPGVLEVNIQPAKNWGELVGTTNFLYEAAHASRLTTEKFMLDGRHSGTGGGNHFVIGGPTPLDSPFLRRPDLLKSLIAYWHNHPSLSYLFSGMFIGPTSQAPRIDEARNDSVYEMEIALRELDRLCAQGQYGCPPWLVDRSLRNLLIDATGNTHRAEFCIDKMYSPDGPAGRMGLLELRAFEMPPHARMSLTQQLLLRSLVARFWQHPYDPPRLKRWGTELHDRFMLPYWVQQDFNDVIAEVADFGYPLRPDWFSPHFEFRFPRYGEFAARGVHVELRAALEPWHVMGEEGAIGGTVRYVDSSVERLQVKVTGLNDDRHVLTCNGRAIPLAPTGNVGEAVAGVRYRAWAPPSALHPSIGVHAPLVFDLVDGWMNRSMGGCQYHVAHPGGRAHETFPINAYEAEGRRLARFFAMGHTPGHIEPQAVQRNPNFPFTLDLRRG